MRVYYKGKYILMDEVTWDILCKPSTLVTEEDPEVGWPEHIQEESIKAIDRIFNCLRRKNKKFSLLESLSKLGGNKYEG